MKFNFKNLLIVAILMTAIGCVNQSKEGVEDKTKNEQMTKEKGMTAAEILGNPDYLAMSYGGYRNVDHGVEPAIDELKEDMRILAAMGVKIVRTYKVHLPQATNLLKAISELKEEDPKFEMYVMLGAWIDCKNAWTSMEPDHEQESEANEGQILVAAHLARKYPDIVKVIAVGNEAMVHWAATYFVRPTVILKWVNHLQELKKSGELPKDLWITCSDDFSSWGGGGAEYHTEDLEKLYHAVDYISMHTYPYHNTHYNPDFWIIPNDEKLSEIEKVDAAMLRARDFAKAQYDSVSNYMKSIGVQKPIHIGETGWATASDGFYSDTGSRATDEYKAGVYYKLMRDWTNEAGISCFYFEGFNEPWKDAKNPLGSENHFGMFTVDGQAKYALWDMVDNGIFESLTRGGKPISKSFGGDQEAMMKTVLAPPVKEEKLE